MYTCTHMRTCMYTQSSHPRKETWGSSTHLLPAVPQVIGFHRDSYRNTIHVHTYDYVCVIAQLKMVSDCGTKRVQITHTCCDSQTPSILQHAHIKTWEHVPPCIPSNRVAYRYKLASREDSMYVYRYSFMVYRSCTYIPGLTLPSHRQTKSTTQCDVVRYMYVWEGTVYTYVAWTDQCTSMGYQSWAALDGTWTFMLSLPVLYQPSYWNSLSCRGYKS